MDKCVGGGSHVCSFVHCFFYIFLEHNNTQAGRLFLSQLVVTLVTNPRECKEQIQHSSKKPKKIVFVVEIFFIFFLLNTWNSVICKVHFR